MAVTVGVPASACGDGPADATFHRDVRPVMERDCLTCHQPGGVAPLDFTYDAEAWADGAPAWAPAPRLDEHGDALRAPTDHLDEE